MQDQTSNGDDAKAAANVAKHKISFETAKQVFKDPFAVERDDDREDYEEPRFTILGMVEGRLLSVAYTLRGEAIRIISARRAEPYEQRLYHENNSE